MRIDRALDSGITFSVSMVEECSKHQIFLCYKILVLSLISLHNTSNKGQLSKSLNSQLLKKSCGLRRQNATQSAVFATAMKVSAIMQFIEFCFLYVAYVKNMCVNYFHCPGSLCIELSLIVSWTRRLTFLIAVNCCTLAPTKIHCVWTILNGDETSKAKLLLVLQEISAQTWRWLW